MIETTSFHGLTLFLYEDLEKCVAVGKQVTLELQGISFVVLKEVIDPVSNGCGYRTTFLPRVNYVGITKRQFGGKPIDLVGLNLEPLLYIRLSATGKWQQDVPNKLDWNNWSVNG